MLRYARRFVVRLTSAICMLGVLCLTGCGKNDQDSADSMSTRAAEHIINTIEQPQDRTRQANEQILQADQRRRENVDGL